MRRIFGLLFFLLILDQLAKNLINSFVPVGTILSYGSSVRLVVGNSHHYAAPEFPVQMVLLCVGAALGFALVGWAFSGTGKLPAHAHILWVAAGCFLFEGITQGLDHALHGYVINYVGFYFDGPVFYAEIAHVGDYVFRFGLVWGSVAYILIAKNELAQRLQLRVQPS